MRRTAHLLRASALIFAVPLAAAGQGVVVTMGGSAESYSGNFSAVTLPIVDSTNSAVAAVGEFGLRGARDFYLGDTRTLSVSFDGGMRQFAAMGFHLRDYAPREWVSQLGLGYYQDYEGIGTLSLSGSYRGHAVEDRPPMPLFLQPGYNSFRGSAGFSMNPVAGVSFDGRLGVDVANYEAPSQLPHLDLLDRKSRSAEGGASVRAGGFGALRLFGGLTWTDYKRQFTDDLVDPFRRDRATNVGLQWSLNRLDADVHPLRASLGVEGTFNRSNSDRPEYDALSMTSTLFKPLPLWELSASANALLTWKSYRFAIPFARLVPGEEADNASVIDLTLSRPLADNLDGHLRFGWTRAETDIGKSYYQRFGTTLLFTFRPGG